MTEAQIKYMVDRFLSWKLPENFSPDAGISFKAEYNEGTPWPAKHEPSGTNLFSAVQAEAMIRHMLVGLPMQPMSEDRVRDVMRLLNVYAPDTFDLEMAATVTSGAINGVAA